MSGEAFDLSFDFAKSAGDGSYVRGWATVIRKAGADVVDHEGDVIYMDDLRQAAHLFVSDARVAKVMHAGEQLGEVVESVIVDDEFAKAVGMTGTERGWWIGMRIDDPVTKARVKSGELKAFSLGGSGKRTPLE